MRLSANPTTRAEAEIPLKANVFDVLLVLHDSEKHGYAIVKTLREQPSGRRLQPGNLYRTLRTLLERGLIAETEPRVDPDVDDQRRRYFRITDFGRAVARAEAARLERLVAGARRRRLIPDVESSR